MRELIYVSIVHPAPQKILELVDSERRHELEQIAKELAPYYDRMTEQLSAINKKKRVHKVYVDSLDITSRLGIAGSGKGFHNIPINRLCQEGAELMTTEDNLLLTIHCGLQEFLAQNPEYAKSFGRDHKYPVALVYDVLSGYFKDDPRALKRVKKMLTGKNFRYFGIKG